MAKVVFANWQTLVFFYQFLNLYPKIKLTNVFTESFINPFYKTTLWFVNTIHRFPCYKANPEQAGERLGESRGGLY
jgi:hypothetical protein